MDIQLTQGKVAGIDEIDSDLAEFKWCFNGRYVLDVTKASLLELSMQRKRLAK